MYGLEKSNATSKDLAGFISTALENGGYYIARYEASFGSGNRMSFDDFINGSTTVGEKAITNQVPAFKESTEVFQTTSVLDDGAYYATRPGYLWNYIRQGDASLACQNLYADTNTIDCDLVNSYAWDTALVFIQKCGGAPEYDVSLPETNEVTNTGTTNDVYCNIYDMGGNLWEWTTETSSYYDSKSAHPYEPCTTRGGYDASGTIANYLTNAARWTATATFTGGQTGFRGVLTVW